MDFTLQEIHSAPALGHFHLCATSVQVQDTTEARLLPLSAHHLKTGTRKMIEEGKHTKVNNM